MAAAAPKVSVVVPAYNAEHYLVDCLDSIVRQPFADMEVLVVDDGSSDRTGEIARSFGRPVVCHRRENGGVAAALNTGIALARGEYVSLVASDDGLCAGATDVQASMLDTHEAAGLVHGGAQEIDGAGRTIGYRGTPRSERVIVQPSARAVRWLLRGNSIVCSSVMIRRACFETLGGFRQDFVPGEDWEMWLRIAAAYDVVYVDRPIARRRIHGASLTSGFTVEMMEASHKLVLRALFDHGPLSGRRGLGRYAYACNDRTLAWLAANVRERRTFLRRLCAALARQPQLVLERETWRALSDGAKAFLPGPVIDAARRVRGGARV